MTASSLLLRSDLKVVVARNLNKFVLNIASDVGNFLRIGCSKLFNDNVALPLPPTISFHQIKTLSLTSQVKAHSCYCGVCSGQLHCHREIGNFLSLHWCSLLWNPQTAASSVNEHARPVSVKQLHCKDLPIYVAQIFIFRSILFILVFIGR